MSSYMLNRDCVTQLNMVNSVSESERQAVLRIFQESGNPILVELFSHYLASMNQDIDAGWLAQALRPPEIMEGKLPDKVHEVVDIMGIGGMFAYLNVLYQAHKNKGRHAVVTNPRDIFTFSGWTVHPEEDMDQRLIEMFQTKSMVFNEMKHILGLSEGPRSVRYKAFRIDYRGMVGLMLESPGELTRNVKVALHYSLLELIDTEKRYAQTNLRRNAATLRALDEMGLIGDDPGRHVANLCGRVVFEVEGEAKIEWKSTLKEQFGVAGRRLTPSEVEAIYGANIPVLHDIRAGRVSAVRYPGGHFVTGYKQSALKAAKEKNILIYDSAAASRIIIDPEAGKHAVTIRLADGTEKTIVADILLMALGDFAKHIITVDGVSTLFAVITENSRYRIHPTGMGEGGTIHIVPVWSVEARKDGRTFHYHLGKATIGAIMGRNPSRPKSLDPDRAFLVHLETNLKRIAPPGATFLWVAATECGRPVSAYQGYTIGPLLDQRGRVKGPHQAKQALNFKATGGCGLGGNTAIIPEVQEILDARSFQRDR